MADLDTKAADTFQPTNHRAGYGDRLAFLMQWLSSHPDATLASGEGRVLLDEITRLRVVADANYRNMERLGVEVEQLREMLCESLLERGVLRAQAEGSAADANAAARPLAAYRAYRAKREGEA